MRKLNPVKIGPKRTVGSYVPINMPPDYIPTRNVQPKAQVILPNVTPIMHHTSYQYVENNKKVAILLHLFYEDLAIEYHNQLVELKKKIDFDLYVSISTGSVMNTVHISNMYVKSFKATIFRFDNIGKDIIPKFRMIEHIYKQGRSYDYVYMFHDKKSPQYQKTDKTTWMIDWRNDLIVPLFNDDLRMSALSIFENNTNIGAIGTYKHLHYGPGWHESMTPKRFKNETLLLQYQDLLYSQFKNKPKVKHSWFIGGTMFWVRWEVLKNFMDNYDYNQLYRLSIEDRGDIKDPSFTHYLERFFGHLVEMNNMKLIGIS